MNSLRFFGCCCASLVVAISISAFAQPNTPRIGYVYPAGARQDSSLEVEVGGQFLDGVSKALVSGAGLKVEVLEHEKPLTQKQFNDLRDKMRELQERRSSAARSGRRGRQAEGAAGSRTNVTWTAADAREMEDIRLKLAKYARRPMNPAIAERVRLRVTVAPEAEPGSHELRLLTRAGLSNPMVFAVGQLPEFCEPRPKLNEGAPARPFRPNTEVQAVAASEMKVTLPATVNGQIMPGGVDRYRFYARKGEHLVAIASARELVPYLADAVPGWFQAALTLRTGKGKELAYTDDYRFHPDPVLHCEIPEDGEYVVEIRDAIYRGREDFVYRISMGNLPFISSIFPLGARVGEKAKVELTGWNLPETTMIEDNTAATPGTRFLSVQKGSRRSNRVPFVLTTLPERLEQEPNGFPGTPQAVSLPAVINGRIGESGDQDTFRFTGKAGAEIVAEVLARRLESPLDSVIKLTDAKGKVLASNDDFEDRGTGLNTHHADSYLRVSLPEDGSYLLQLGDAQRQGGPEYAYRLRLSAPQPDFELRVVPSSLNVRAGVWTPVTVHALRKDGFSGPIELVLKDAPPGFALSGARVPAGQDLVRFTLAAPPFADGQATNLSLEGRAVIEGRRVARPAVPADDLMQAFAYRHLVPTEHLTLAVVGQIGARTVVKVLDDVPVKIPAGGSAKVRIGSAGIGGAPMLERVELELNEPPDGIRLGKTSPIRQGAELLIETDAAKVKPGLKGNLIVSFFTTGARPGAKAQKQANPRRFAGGVLPAIPFEVVEN